MKSVTAGIIVLALGFWASTAVALVSFEVNATTSSGGTLDQIVPGDLVTLDIRLSNPTGASIYGVGAAIQGYDPNIFQFVSGVGAIGPFFCTDVACSTGLDNFIAGPLVESQASGVGSYVQFINAFSITGWTGDCVRDPGLDGIVNGGMRSSD